MSASIILYAIVAVITLAALVHAWRSPERELTRADGARVKWLLAAMVIWIFGLRFLASELSSLCDMNLSPLTRGATQAFLDCSPRLLSGGPTDIFLFFWIWIPPFLGAVILTWYVLRQPHQSRRR